MSKTLKTAVLIFLFLFIPRLWILLNSSYTFYSDDAIYAILARSWTLGEWQYVFHPTWPPLYPGLSAIIALVIPGFENALRFTSLIFGTAVVIPLYFLLRHTMPQFFAISFSLAVAIFTPVLTMSLLPLYDSLAVFLIISGLVSVFLGLNLNDGHRLKLLLLGSGCFGLVYLTRTEGTMFFFLTLIFLLSQIIRVRTKKYFLTVLLFITVFVITISPYVIASRVQIGEWSLSPKFSAQIQQGHAFALNNRGTTWAQEVTSPKAPDFQSHYFRNGTGYLLDRLYYFMRLYPEKQLKWQAVFLSIFPVWIIPLILVGVASVLKGKSRWGEVYLIFIMAAAIPITIFSTPVHDIRYLVWTIPLFLYFYYLGVLRVVKKGWATAILALCAVFIFPGATVDNLINLRSLAGNFSRVYNRSELRDAGLWIKNHTSSPIPKVMIRHEGVEFYSGGETVYMPQVSYGDLLEYAKKNNVDFIVAWDEELAGDKELATLLGGQAEHSGLQEVYSTKGLSSIIIYTLAK